MTSLVVALIVVLLAVGGGAGALAIRSKRDYDAGNQVVPGVATKAPSSWGGAHTPEALLHRRLRGAVLASHQAASVGLGDARSTIEQAALALDDRLVAAAALPGPHREERIAALAPAVEALEQAVSSMSALPSGTAERGAMDQAVADVQVRLEALAQARAEVDGIDRNGTTQP